MVSPDRLQILTADHDIRFNAVLDHWTGVGDFHAAGYRRAAEILLQRFLTDPEGTAGERDTVVLPILFLFRQYLELRFKDIIVYGHVLSDQQAQWRHGHDLDRLWAEVQHVCSTVYESPLPTEFVTITDCVSDLRQIDPNSESFRYARDRNDRPIFEHVVVGLRALSATIPTIGNCLDGISFELSVRVQDRA